MIGHASITGLVLAGGQGSRMGGLDKGLQPWQGTPLALNALRRLQQQAGEWIGPLAISANRHLDDYRRFGAPVWTDTFGDFAGPLAGVLAGLQACTTPFLLTVPCDSPVFPLDLAERLAAAFADDRTEIAMAATRDSQGQLQRQPVFCLMRAALLPSLTAFMALGGRKMGQWAQQHRTVLVPFDEGVTAPPCFSNINTLAELQAPSPTLPPAHDLRAAEVGQYLAGLVDPIQDHETVGIFDALDRVLANDVISPIHVPPHDNSAMDGYAFDGRLLVDGQPLLLHTVGTALAGTAWAGSVAPGQCVKIMTGAMLPAGTDTVVPVELVHADGGHIHLPAGRVRAGDNRRLRGEDLTAGRPALTRGQTLGPAALGLLASLGLSSVPVVRRPTVAYFSTGNEILSLGEPAREGAVYDSNRYTVFGLLARMGVRVLDLGVIKDDPAALEAAFRHAAREADAVITSGGVSMGEADHTKATMRQLGNVAFWQIAIRPGRPMAAGRIRDGEHSALLFGLPGNPVAVMVTFLAFVRPALRRLMGCTSTEPVLMSANSAEALRKRPGRTEYQRGIVWRDADGTLRVRTTGHQGSGVLRSMVEANGLIVLHHDQGPVPPGDPVDVMLFDGAI